MKYLQKLEKSKGKKKIPIQISSLNFYHYLPFIVFQQGNIQHEANNLLSRMGAVV